MRCVVVQWNAVVVWWCVLACRALQCLRWRALTLPGLCGAFETQVPDVDANGNMSPSLDAYLREGEHVTTHRRSDVTPTRGRSRTSHPTSDHATVRLPLAPPPLQCRPGHRLLPNTLRFVYNAVTCRDVSGADSTCAGAVTETTAADFCNLLSAR